MKTTKRFDRAVKKLYNAFHNGELIATNCTACAVGNICDNNADVWSSFGHIIKKDTPKSPIRHITFYEVYEGIIDEPDIIELVSFTGYLPRELAKVEYLFLKEFIGIAEHDKEAQFRGLCAVVEYLCELDGIPNIMDYQSLFEYDESDKPINELVL